MPRSRSALSRFSIPLIAFLLLLVPAAVYYYFYTQSQRQYFSSRNFRQLSVMSEQLTFTLHNYKRILKNASDKDEPQAFLENFVRELQSARAVRVSERPERQPSFAIKLVNHDGGWHIRLSYTDPTNDIQAERGVRELVDRFPGADVFDDVLLASENGTVVYQKGKSSLRFANLSGLNLPAGANPKPGQWTPQGASRLFSGIEISGTRYDIYLQPLPISDMNANELATEWTICALVRSRRFVSESLAISYDLIIWFLSLSALILLTLPILKVQSLSGWDSFRRRDMIALFICTCCIGSLLVLLGLHLYHFEVREVRASPLERLAKDINQEVKAELQQISKQLRAYCNSDDLWEDIRANTAHRQAQSWVPGAPLPPHRRWRAPVNAERYPHLKFAVWADESGWQWIKWDVRNTVTPFINIDERLQGLKRSRPWVLAPEDGETFIPYRLELVFSQNTGEYIANYVVRTSDCIDRPEGDAQKLAMYDNDPLISNGYAYIATELNSLSQPVLPPDVGFALVDQEGRTLVHSDAIRNQWENFFLESDENERLRAAVLARSVSPMHIRYQGRGHEAFVTRLTHIPDMPFSLVVFRDLTALQTMHLETQTLAGFLLIPYLGVLTIAGILAMYLASRRYPSAWIWPSANLCRCYRLNTVLYSLLLILLAVWIVVARSPELYFSIVVIGLVAAILTFTILRSGPAAVLPTRLMATMAIGVLVLSLAMFTDIASAFLLPGGLALVFLACSSRVVRNFVDRPWRLSCQSGYALMATLLTAVIGVVPCIACFKIAHDLEMDVLVRAAQIDIAKSATERFSKSSKKHEQIQVLRAKVQPEPEQLIPSDAYRYPYLAPFFGTEVRFGAPQKGEMPYLAGAFERLLGSVRIAYNRGVSRTSSLPLSLDYSNWTWIDGDWPKLRYRSRPRAASGDPAAISVDTELHRMAGFTSIPAATEALPDVAYWIFTSAVALLVVFLITRHFATTIAMPEIVAAIPARAQATMTMAAVSGDGTSSGANYWTSTLEELRARLSGNPNAAELVEILDRECGSTECLRKIGRELAAAPGIADATPSTIRFALEEACESHYRSLWRSLTSRERFVLHHLATDGTVNPKNASVLHGLIRRGLVVAKPRFEILNESFCAYVSGHVRPMEASAWATACARHGSRPTRNLLLLLVPALIGFLFLTQPELVQTSVGFLTALAAVAGALMKLLPSQAATTTNDQK